jgi:hypothetical protein
MQFQEQDYFKNEIFETLKTKSILRGKKWCENRIICGTTPQKIKNKK